MQQLTRRRPTSSILSLRLLSLLSLLLIGPCHPQPISCNNETESLFQLWFDNFSSYSSSSLSSGINTNGKESVLFPSSGSIVWKLQQRNNRHVAAGTLRYHSYESWEELPEEEILCIPKNECYLLEVEDLTLDQFRVELDGIPITPGPAYPIHHGAAIKSTTEIGHISCKPTCNPINETLLDVTIFTGESNQVDWKIIDDSHHGTVMSSCRQHENENSNYCGWDAWETYHVHECLLTASVANPANSFSCYRFLWRDASENLNPPGHRTYPHITLTADFISVPVVPSTTTNSTTDKKNMTSTNATTTTNTLEMDAMAPFESVWLGGSSHNHCHPSCQNVNQSQLELFVSRDETSSSSSSSLSTTQPQKQVDWSLVDLVQEEVAYKDSILWEDGSNSNAGDTWHYVQHCVPRDACLEFFLSMSQREPTEETTIVSTTTAQTESSTTTTTTTQTTKTTSSGQYMLLLDNIMYADNNNYQFSIGGEDPKQKDRVVTNGIIIGNDCPSTICKSNSFSYEASGSLMALELVAMTAASSAAKEAADSSNQNNTVTNTTTTTSTATTSTINTGSYYHLEWSLSGVTQYSDKSTTTMKGYFGYNRSGYRRYDCIPQHCFHLDVSVDDAKTQAIDSYSVTVDGRLYEDAKLNRFGQDDGPGWYQLSFLDCKDEEEDFITSAGISGGALAAAIVCSILGACLCVYIANRVLNLSKEYDRRMNNRNNITDDDEKTTASEDRHDDEPIGRIVHIPGASEEDP